MSFKKITENVSNITLLADQPSLSANLLKKEFDKGNETIKTAFNNQVDDLNEVVENIADEYDNTLTYKVGDYCIYENKLYKCITEITTPESFDSSKWESVRIVDEINNKFEWKFLKSVTGKTPISLPENFNELFICCNLNKDHYTNIIPKVILSTTSKNFNINGRKTSSSYGAGATSDISLSSYVLRFLYSNDVDRSQETTSTIYYR